MTILPLLGERAGVRASLASPFSPPYCAESVEPPNSFRTSSFGFRILRSHLDRERRGKRRTFAVFARHRQVAAHQLAELAAQRQPQTSAAIFLRRARVCLGES